MQVVGLSRLWMLAALLGTKASCMEEEGAMVKKKQRDKNMCHVHCQSGSSHLVGAQGSFE